MPLGVQGGCDVGEAHPLLFAHRFATERLHPRDGGPFRVSLPERLAALAPARFPANAVAGGASLEDDTGLIEFGHGSKDLANEPACGVVRLTGQVGAALSLDYFYTS